MKCPAADTVCSWTDFCEKSWIFSINYHHKISHNVFLYKNVLLSISSEMQNFLLEDHEIKNLKLLE